MENEQIEMEHVMGVMKKTDILIKSLIRIKFKQIKSLSGTEEIDLPNSNLN